MKKSARAKGAARKKKKKKRSQLRKVCRLTVDRVVYIDYKDVSMLKHYVTERGGEAPAHVDAGDQAGTSDRVTALHGGLTGPHHGRWA